MEQSSRRVQLLRDVSGSGEQGSPGRGAACARPRSQTRPCLTEPTPGAWGLRARDLLSWMRHPTLHTTFLIHLQRSISQQFFPHPLLAHLYSPPTLFIWETRQITTSEDRRRGHCRGERLAGKLGGIKAPGVLISGKDTSQQAWPPRRPCPMAVSALPLTAGAQHRLRVPPTAAKLCQMPRHNTRFYC